MWGSLDLPSCARQHTRGFLTSPLGERWSTAGLPPSDLHQGPSLPEDMPSGRLSGAVPPWPSQPATSSQCLFTISKKQKILLYLHLLYLPVLWNRPNSSLTQTCKREFFKICFWSLIFSDVSLRKHRYKRILTFAAFLFASLHINRIFNELI